MIDKNKAYRFNGDSERWEAAHQGSCIRSTATNDCIPMLAAERLHERGILLEYPELPGDDWEFCESGEQDMSWNEEVGEWWHSSGKSWSGIYCRKKKPVYEFGYCHALAIGIDADVYWTTDPEKGKELLK